MGALGRRGHVAFGLVAVRRALDREAQATAREKAFIAGVTHELRTPLAAIRLFGETLADGRGDPREYGALVARESERLEALVERVLAVTRVEEAPPSRPCGRRSSCARRSVLARGPRAGRSSLEARRRRYLPEPGTGRRSSGALLNLLDNAVQHGREGGRVECGASPTRTGSVSVSDDGPGIGRRERRPSSGASRRGRSEAPGTGLGLYLVEHVARAHGGRVDLVTEEGRGSTFTLVLPAGSATPPGFPA